MNKTKAMARDLITVDISGGCDSTAICLLYKERGIDFEMLFADTGAELPENYWFLPRLAKYLGKKLNVVSNGGMFLWLVKQGFFLPYQKTKWCTRILKIIPMAKYHGNKPYIHAIGIRADEPKRIRNGERCKKNEEIIYPLVEAGMDKKDVKKLCEKHDMVNPVYQWRTNVSCFCCPNQRLSDWRNLYRVHPELFRVAEAWEEMGLAQSKKGYGWRSDRWTIKKIRENQERKLYLFPETIEVSNEPN